MLGNDDGFDINDTLPNSIYALMIEDLMVLTLYLIELYLESANLWFLNCGYCLHCS